MESPSPENKTLPCDIVLLPSREQARLAASASQQLASQGSLFTLDNEHFFAHSSLYMFQMNVSDQVACIDALRRLAEQTKSQQLTQDGYFYQDSGHGKGYVDIAFKRNTEADALQQRTVEAFNSLRAGMRESDKAKMTDATGLKLENLQKYGYPAIGALFRPHITLTKFPIEIEPNLAGLPDPSIYTGEFTHIGLFEMGTNGTCIRKIAEFELV